MLLLRANAYDPSVMWTSYNILLDLVPVWDVPAAVLFLFFNILQYILVFPVLFFRLNFGARLSLIFFR